MRKIFYVVLIACVLFLGFVFLNKNAKDNQMSTIAIEQTEQQEEEAIDVTETNPEDTGDELETIIEDNGDELETVISE